MSVVIVLCCKQVAVNLMTNWGDFFLYLKRETGVGNTQSLNRCIVVWWVWNYKFIWTRYRIWEGMRLPATTMFCWQFRFAWNSNDMIHQWGIRRVIWWACFGHATAVCDNSLGLLTRTAGGRGPARRPEEAEAPVRVQKLWIWHSQTYIHVHCINSTPTYQVTSNCGIEIKACTMSLMRRSAKTFTVRVQTMDAELEFSIDVSQLN